MQYTYTKEDVEQIAFCDWLQIQKNKGKVIEYFAIQNENKMSWAVKNKAHLFAITAKQKKMGKKRGVSDICVILKNKVLFVEMKRKAKQLKTKQSKAGINISKEQLEFLETIKKSDIADGKIAFGAKEAIEFVKMYIT